MRSILREFHHYMQLLENTSECGSAICNLMQHCGIVSWFNWNTENASSAIVFDSQFQGKALVLLRENRLTSRE